MGQFHVLSASPLAGKTAIVTQPDSAPLERVLEGPALSMMTDLTRVRAVSALPDESIDAAHERMLQGRVRMLFVVDHEARLIGLLTTNDILSEKPMQIVRERCIPHDEIRVQDIMTPAEAVEALDINDVSHARVGDIVETMRNHARQHALVMRRDGDAMPHVCGVFSAADLSRRLGIPVVPVAVAHTFAEIEEMLARE